MAVQLPRVGVTADLRVHVPRDDQGTLVDGARSVVERVDAVDEIDEIDVRSVRPDLNTVYTDVRADLTVAGDGAGSDPDVEPDAERDVEPERVADRLREGFGVDAVEIRDVGPPR